MLKTKIKLILATSVLIPLLACTNMASLKTSSSGSRITLTNVGVGTSNVSYTHSLQNVNITAQTSGTNPGLDLSLSVVAGALPLTQFCVAGNTSTMPCTCVLSWKEINTVGGNNITVSRTKRLPVSVVQGALVKCQMPQAFWNEIPAATVMRMNVVGVSPNVSGLSVKDLGYKKGTGNAPSGDFVDDTLTPFRNIMHYSCYSKKQASFEVLNQVTQATAASSSAAASSAGQTVNVILSSAMCADASSNCSAPRSDYSAQSYYRNLYVRSDKTGEINSSNARYECPLVYESIRSKATTPPTVPASEQNDYWPLDSTFSVSTVSSAEWSVPITAASTMMKNGEASDSMTASERLQEINNGNSGITWKILGYGKVPNSDGTCGHIVDSNGMIRPLTRLRRFRVVYPPMFMNNGQTVSNERLEADQVLIPDRLVVDPTGKLTGSMIYGPKPCNFSWFDHEGVTNRGGNSTDKNFLTTIPAGMPGYVATSKYYYHDSLGNDISVNPDGRILPNFDRPGAVGALDGPSCSATIAVYDEAGGVPIRARLLTSYFNRSDKITLGSRNFFLKELHMTPVDRWSPEYVEDTSFKACVPSSDRYVEPPMHFYRDAAANGGNVSWCSKVYPTQNPYWQHLNAKKKITGSSMSDRVVNWGATAANMPWVKWFTSHITSGSGLDTFNVCTSTHADKICEFSLGSTSHADYNTCVSYLTNTLNSVGAYQNRCDRTVKHDSFVDSRGFPLLASDTDIRDLLKSDATTKKSYSCVYSVHANPNKVGRDQPMSNCCGIKSGRAVLDPGGLPKRLDYDTPANEGHLEPYLDPAFPDTRFCGNPVE